MYSFILSIIIVFGLTAVFAKSITTIIYAFLAVKSISITIAAIVISFIITIKILRFIFNKGGD